MKSERLRAGAGGPVLGDKIEALVRKVKEKKITVRLKFEKDCRMEHVRAYMALRQIHDLCTDVKTYPEHVEQTVYSGI